MSAWTFRLTLGYQHTGILHRWSDSRPPPPPQLRLLSFQGTVDIQHVKASYSSVWDEGPVQWWA